MMPLLIFVVQVLEVHAGVTLDGSARLLQVHIVLDRGLEQALIIY